jgi:threonine aldolase
VLCLCRPPIGPLQAMIRLVTHHDIARRDVDRALRIVREALKG